MEKWQKDLFEILETLADGVEHFYDEASQMVETFLAVSEEITEQVQSTISTEIEQYLHELTEPFLEIYWELEEVIGEVDQPFPYPVEPTREQNPACINCRHYHGQVYSGNLLVCGMHPYGWEDKNCPDWEEDIM